MEKADGNLNRFRGLCFDRDRAVLELVKRRVRGGGGFGPSYTWPIKYQLG